MNNKTVYFAHATNHPNFRSELYAPLKKLTDIDLVLPHEKDLEVVSSKEKIRNSDLFICDISFASLGSGIEIGWANSFTVPILFIYKKGSKISNSVEVVSDNFFKYDILEKDLSKLEKVIKRILN